MAPGMSRPLSVKSAICLLLAIVCASCDPAPPQRILTVEEVEPRIDDLDGETVNVAGYLSGCGGYDCHLYRNKKDADEWDRVMAAVHAGKRVKVPDVPTLGIGNGTNFDFDEKAAPFRHSYVVITGTVTNMCRFEGKPACTDRGPDIKPTSIRARDPATG